MDVYHRPEVLYNTKIQPDKPFLTKGGFHNPSMRKLFLNVLMGQFFVNLPMNYIWYET